MTLPRPAEDTLQAPFWEAASNGELAFQRCRQCAHAFLPAREECPACLEPEPGWDVAEGEAKLVSWVVYHRAFHPAFAARLPYIVAVVELAEGARLISNLTGVGNPAGLSIGQKLRLAIEQDDGVAVPRFRLD